MPDDEKGRTLLAIARNAIAQRLGLPTQPVDDPDWLSEPRATFVTLMQQGKLRGCIGSLQAHRPLFEDVYQNALAAAFRDPRFSPLTEDEFDGTRVEVSLLSPQQPMQFKDEADALARLHPNVDGVVLEYGHKHSTFLPQVWEQLPDPRQFMAHLKNKAGLPENFWAPEIKLYRYTVEKWKE